MPDERMVTTTAVHERITPRSEAEVVDAVRNAVPERVPLRIVGRGGWLHAGNPVEAPRSLDLSGLRGIVEYVPGDLTLTALAGTTLSEIADATAAHGQWLPLDPFGGSQGTLGATLATASSGPLGGSIGLPRDVTVGVSFVTGTGDVVRGGGRVVKNVAGFDLVRLTIGAWGTLGVITGATVRLRARPEIDETFALELPPERDALATLLSTVRAAAVEPLAAELLSTACAKRIGLGERALMLVRLAGNDVGVQHQRATLAKLAACEPLSNDAWSSLRESDPAGSVVVRISRRPSELARLWSTTTAVSDIDAHATLARGVVRLRLTSGAGIPDGYDASDRRVFETGADNAADSVSSNGVISRRLRDAFDPQRIFNRGILGEERS